MPTWAWIAASVAVLYLLSLFVRGLVGHYLDRQAFAEIMLATIDNEIRQTAIDGKVSDEAYRAVGKTDPGAPWTPDELSRLVQIYSAPMFLSILRQHDRRLGRPELDAYTKHMDKLGLEQIGWVLEEQIHNATPEQLEIAARMYRERYGDLGRS